MSRQYSAYDVSDFLSNSVGGLLDDIETATLSMLNEDDYDERYKCLADIQDCIVKIKEII